MSVPALDGVGVHGGRRSVVRLHRVDGPVRFRSGRSELTPDARHVVATRGATTLGGDGVRIGTVEHLLAALQVRGVFAGLLIEVVGDELPILDGSAAPWDEALAGLGPFPPPPAASERTAAVADGDRSARHAPGPRRLDVTVAYDDRRIGTQRWAGGPDRWAELLPARTFGFARDAERLRAAGLALGSSERNAIVYHDDAPPPPLRFPDEPVRHKALDALGDLYLLGVPFAGRVEVRRGGHDLHLALVKRLLGARRVAEPEPAPERRA